MQKAQSARTPLGQLLSRIKNILEADTSEFRQLVQIAGLDPKLNFKNVELNGVPLAGQDLRGFDFSGANLCETGIEDSQYDCSTIFTSAKFSGRSLDPEVVNFNQRLLRLGFQEMEKAINAKLSQKYANNLDVISFTTLIKRAPREEIAEHWYNAMCSVRIPIQSGHQFRFEAGRDSDLMPATIPK